MNLLCLKRDLLYSTNLVRKKQKVPYPIKIMLFIVQKIQNSYICKKSLIQKQKEKLLINTLPFKDIKLISCK